MKKTSKRKIAAVGAGLAVASAGAYYLLGPNKKAHQKKAKKLFAKIKKEAMSRAKQAKTIANKAVKKSVKKVKSRIKSRGKKRG